MKYIAHIDNKGNIQTIYEHLKGTAERAAKFAEPFHAQKQAEAIGWAHDIGKYTSEFQHRILGQGKKVDHATAGALELWKKRNLWGALCVAGHHGGLPDCGTKSDSSMAGTLCGRIRKQEEGLLADYSAYAGEVALPDVAAPDWARQSLNAYFYTKMLFSCLVDADFLDTEEFMNGGRREKCSRDTMDLLLARLNDRVSDWKNPVTQINRLRCQILNSCIEMGKRDRGLYSLTVPTGGGKTVASLAFALNQAVAHGMKRVIYVIPYTSIIDQNAAVFTDILGRENVLAHYSEAVYDDRNELDQRKKLAAENWDVPVVVTTSVQFFESIYANKPSRSRKLHNIAESVIVFDEYQMLPVKYMRPCAEAIYQFVKYYGCTALICTATQPGTNRFFHEMKCREIAKDPPALYRELERVRYCLAGKLDEQALCSRLMEQKQVLCIVNTRKAAQDLYTLLLQCEAQSDTDCPDAVLDGRGNYHLSTWILPRDRKHILDEVRKRLADGEVCRVVSTSIIEAGIDVDFPVVYREENGLDSVIQAAGRCNREGKRAVSDSRVWIFQSDRLCPKAQRANRDAMRETLQKISRTGYEIGSPKSVETYFEILFDCKGEEALDSEKILMQCERGAKTGPLPFRTISEHFHLIDQETKTVYVPVDAVGLGLTKRLADGERSRGLFRELGRYALNLYSRDYNRLKEQGMIWEYDEEAAVLSNLSLYSGMMGLQLPECEEGMGFFI